MQFLGQLCCTFAGPAKRRFGVTPSNRINQFVKVSQQTWISFYYIQYRIS
ncbi:conserved hypothetical protein [delta proteobacterium NaphS2]|nr:conserved hypothetical protein [delta proteobacterium NaphS2]